MQTTSLVAREADVAMVTALLQHRPQTRLITLAANSFSVAAVTALIAVGIALVMAYAARLTRSPLVPAANRLAGLGYAVPGAVIAVGVLMPLGRLDNALAGWLEQAFGFKIAQGELFPENVQQDPQFVQDGKVTAKGIAARHVLPPEQ